MPSLLAIDGTPPDAKTLADSEQLAAVAKTRDASHYKGDLVKGERWGKGTYIYKDGSVYDGEWRANKRHGVGKHTSADGSLYDGEWNYDQRSGSGKFMSTHDGMLPFFRCFFRCFFPPHSFKIDFHILSMQCMTHLIDYVLTGSPRC